MKLRTKFTLLIAAIVIIPLVLTPVISYFIINSQAQSEAIKQNRKIAHWLVQALYSAESSDDMNVLIKDIPEGVDIIILDQDNYVRSSSVPGVEQNIQVQPETLMADLTTEFPDRSFIYDPF